MSLGLENWKGNLVRNCGMGVSVERGWVVFWKIIRWAPQGGSGGCDFMVKPGNFYTLLLMLPPGSTGRKERRPNPTGR